jgi:hypothetical protein
MVRLLIIGISALCSGLLFIWVFAIGFPLRFPDWLGLSFFGGSCALGGAIAWHFCGRPSLKPTDFARTDYEKLGLLVSEEFVVRRAFEVEEYEDEGLHFFLELEDGRVLFLCGQYLYDYQDISDDPELNQKASFPCQKFTVRRHKNEHWVHSILIHGPYLKPEAKLPHYSKAYKKEFGFPSDGEIFTTPYDDILSRIAEKKA